MSSRALDIKLGLDINQNCYQKFVKSITFVPIEQGTFVTFVPIEQGTKVTNETNVPYSIGTKVTILELDWTCDMTHAVHVQKITQKHACSTQYI